MSSQTTPASSISKVRTLLGSWSRTPPQTDLEAQTIAGVHVPVELELAAPSAAQTRAPRAQSPAEEEGTNPIDDFFGVTRRAGTQDSRHDAVHEPMQQDAPPPYAADPPAYTPKPEFPTLAMYLFKFGFREYLIPTST